MTLIVDIIVDEKMSSVVVAVRARPLSRRYGTRLLSLESDRMQLFYVLMHDYLTV